MYIAMAKAHFRRLPTGILVCSCLLALLGVMTLYSVAGMSFDPWAKKQILRFSFCFALMIGVTLVPLQTWLKYAYWIYGGMVLLLVVVFFVGHVGMGAQRWINLGFMQLQPSETMKIGLIMALARYFHGVIPEERKRVSFLMIALLMIAIPFLLVAEQPDLGTAGVIFASSIVIFFLTGIPMWIFITAGLLAPLIGMIGWRYALHDYQKQRVLTFLDPSRDPLGAGYHITQSKIAFGSGGFWGRGWGQGTQNRLDFIPERHTDFIFSVFAEEFGLVGTVFALSLCLILVGYGYSIALSCRNQFGRLLCLGITTLFFMHVFINLGMITGIVPVVGVPFPLMSYGGTSMLTTMIGFGLICNVSLYRRDEIRRATFGARKSFLGVG
jgi:rod shape determining protein RodA